MALSKDLQSIQEARDLVEKAKEAQLAFRKATQEQVDKIVKAMADAGYAAAEKLGRMAHEETGFGKPEDKKLKNEFATRRVWESIKDLKTVGVINDDKEKKIIEIAEPMGVVAALIPSTNPTSTVIFKAIISVKGRNGFVASPHPRAVNCTAEATRIIAQAAEAAGAPPGLIACMTIASVVFTAFHIAEVYNELDIHKWEFIPSGKEREELNLTLETLEKLWSVDADRYFWTVFIRNAILRENPNLNPVEVIEWANVWYLVCRETGEDILLSLAIASIESSTWVTVDPVNGVDDRDSFVRFDPRAISPKGALGLFQLMSPTAREVADNLGIYYDKSVKSPSDAIISVSTDTSASVNEKRQLVREIILKHVQKYPGSIEAVTLNPVNNIRMGIYYLTYLRKFNLPLEGRIESYNAGLAGHISGRAREETVPYREKVLWRHRVYKNEADSAKFDLWTDRSTAQQVELSTPLTGSTQLSSTVAIVSGAENIEEAQ